MKYPANAANIEIGQPKKLNKIQSNLSLLLIKSYRNNLYMNSVQISPTKK